jgi:glycine/D-amino acid oxidase-like deaminating enzyme
MMHRRTVLELFGGVALAGLPSLQPLVRSRVVIAGGGMLGANIAYQLARRGASVTVVERDKPAMGATAKSFAWINAKKRPRDYFELNRLGIHAWLQLERELDGKLPLIWGGSLEWRADAKAREAVADDVRNFQGWGYGARLIDEPALRALEPKIVSASAAGIAHWEDEGQVDPVGATEMILVQAAKAGARVEYPAEVTAVDIRNDRLRAVRTTKGEIESDVLVIACGTDTARVAALAGVKVPLRDAPGVLVHVPPQPRLVQHVLLSPLGNIKQKVDGRIVTGIDFGAGGGDDSREAGERFLKTIAAVLPPLGNVPVEKMTRGFRPMPQDGRPIVGFPTGRADVYIAVMHSGVTLGPLIGRLAATEILDRVEVDVLSPYRLSRFTV